MYTVKYWNPRELAWKGVGSGQFATLPQARTEMYALVKKCQGAVHFRVFEIEVPV